MSEEGQLLFISDLEGCVPNWTPNANKPLPINERTPQNVSLCDAKTYSTYLPNFLYNNKNNKIAFLGDYFDKGPGAETSIIGIAKLKTDFSSQVHIILGNRDINKLRLFYELQDNHDFKPINGLQTWSELFKPVVEAFKEENDDDFVKRFVKYFSLVDIILRISMGADGLIPYWCEDNKDCRTNQRIYISKLVSVFTDPNDTSEFARAVKTIFEKGKIVEYDEDFNVLMSHAGGFDESVFRGYPARIERIKQAVSDKAEAETETETKSTKPISYFDKMEIARKGLEATASNSDEVNTNKYDIKENESSFNLSNKILESVVTSIFNTNPNPKPSEDFFILQASGLKPSVEFGGENAQKFASFIQSCGSGCNSTSPVSKYLSEKFAPQIFYGEKKIKFIAHGHVPHCLPFPLLVNNNGTTFIHNDTSNGQKPTKLVGTSITELPFAYLEKNSEKNVTPKIGNISAEGGKNMTPYNSITLSNKNSLGFSLEPFKQLILDMNAEKINTTNIATKIKWNGLNTATTEPEPAPAPPPQGGGKTRRRRKNRSRNSKKASSKRRPRRNRSRNRK
jgi:hypothetical protein